ncbi:hypothetical protein EXE43_18920 [Halorubrum sp. SS5]|uniref:hypothetical protein n=1 Tax=Halorubrum sp. SS7 TaxID=2518119 RepID=UPI0010F656E8|nr:hypothetical protein [Halorubrum sp. SS7]TKX57270.1 hypothetical protein EXE44_10915 [Halorubrum sp. SS7]TKX84433.1 hypothetical protein EXE43_18920 [Halorubrum sp. SS5]
MGDDVDPEDPRPDAHYHVDRDAEWYYVDDDLAGTIALGPATDGEPGDDWVLTLSAATSDEDPDPAERVAVRLTPWALHELYLEARNLSPDARQAGHTAECGLCGEQVPLDRAWPDNRKRPCHPDCYADAFGAPPWYDGH